ncbi:hypothetical protein BJ973_005156 [Actinoplanes tereljensis]|uniref:Uncharacterized protein n=1 Tax=Paractinoplanes tereljensis TaxID=571912 RepID=A0A919TUX2_9ACTN|nr:hypothetical protein [Actinoplanes tereljensis]GIF21397.1 hypothetical protein Ate02nite_41270 [Actinoplanes tereljensis]
MSQPQHAPDGDLDLVIKAVGPSTEGGRLPLAELARLASGLQASLERIALSLSGGTARPGRRPREIVDAVRLDIVGFQTGSAILHVERTGQLGLDDLLGRTLDALEEGILSLLRDPSTLPAHFTSPVINGIRDLTGGISPDGITRIEFARGGTTRFTVDAALQSAIRSIGATPVQQMATVVGRLHMGDFSPAALRCRVDTYAGSVLCDFGPDLRDAVLDAMDEMVMAEGIGEIDPNGASIHLLHLTGLGRLASARPESLDTLARQQEVQPLRSVDELGGEQIGDLEDFMTAIRSARG